MFGGEERGGEERRMKEERLTLSPGVKGAGRKEWRTRRGMGMGSDGGRVLVVAVTETVTDSGHGKQ